MSYLPPAACTRGRRPVLILGVVACVGFLFAGELELLGLALVFTFLAAHMGL